MINTVLGPLEPSQLGFTLMHEHIVIQSVGLRDNWPQVYDRPAIVRTAVEALQSARAHGVDTLVDLTTMDLGRDLPLIQEIVRQAGVQVVVATGVHIRVPRYFEGLSPDAGADLFVDDITRGIQGTGVKAGIIKLACNDRVVAGGYEVTHRAGARAHRRTGVPISTHTEVHNQTGLDQLRIFAEEGVDLSRVVIGHSGDTEDFDYLQRLLDRGCYLGLDRFGLDQIFGIQYLTTDRRVRQVAELCRRGYADRLVLSHDASCYADSRPADMRRRFWPSWHYNHIPVDVLPALREAGVSEAQIDLMTRANPRRIFEQAGPY